jgi:hypothetical protein
MNKNPSLLEPTMAAVFTPVFLLISYSMINSIIKHNEFDIEELVIGGFAALVVSFIHAILLGLPAVSLLRKLDKMRWWSVTLVGFIVGCVPTTLIMWPLWHKGGFSYWDGTKIVITRENGIPTLAGWTEYMQSVLIVAAIGAISGFVFWFVLRRISNLQFDTSAKGAGQP